MNSSDSNLKIIFANLGYKLTEYTTRINVRIITLLSHKIHLCFESSHNTLHNFLERKAH
jgi:hypothetical protein